MPVGFRFGGRDVYTVGQTAKLIGVHRNTVRLWCASGRIPCMRTPGGHYRIADAALSAMAVDPTLGRSMRPENDNATRRADPAA